MGQYLDNKIVSAIKYLWDQQPIQDIYKKSKSTKISSAASYFWDSIDRINNRYYIPSEYDVLRVSYKPTRIMEQKYTLNHNTFNVINVGGQRSDWKKWIDCFSNVDIAVFVASLECYDSELNNYSHLIMNEYI